MPGVASAIAGAIISAVGATGVAATIITAVVNIAVGIGTSILSQLFADEPEPEDRGITTEQTTTGDTTPQKFVLGTIGLEGHLVAPSYSRYTNKNKVLTYILEVSNIPVKGLTGRVIIDGQYADIIDEPPEDGSDNFANPNAKRLDGFRKSNGRDMAWITFYDGTQTTADAFLVAEYGSHPERPWTSDHILEGTAYAVVEFKQEPKFFNGLPAVRFEVDGIALYDPREDTTVGGSGAQRWADPSTWTFTKNPQVMAYNIYRGITLPTGDVYGGGVPEEDLPLDNWFAAMNECDVLIGSRPQFEAGLEIDTNEMTPLEAIRELNKASFAESSTLGGIFRVRVGAPTAAVMTLTDADFDIIDGSTRSQFPGLKDTRNAITAKYVSPVDVYEQRTLEPITNATWETDDGDRRNWVDVNFRAVTDNSQGQQLMQAMINDDRRFITHEMTLPPSFARLELLDTIEYTSERFGYTDKLFEVVRIESRPNTIQQVVKVREREQTDNDWTSADDVPVPLARNGYVAPDPTDFATFTASPKTLQDGDSVNRRPAIELTWTFATDDEVEPDQVVEWQVRHKGLAVVVAEGTTLASKLQDVVSAGIIPAQIYEARAKPVVPPFDGDWTAWQDVTAPNVLADTVDIEDEAVSSEVVVNVDPATLPNSGVLQTDQHTGGSTGFGAVNLDIVPFFKSSLRPVNINVQVEFEIDNSTGVNVQTFLSASGDTFPQLNFFSQVDRNSETGLESGVYSAFLTASDNETGSNFAQTYRIRFSIWNKDLSATSPYPVATVTQIHIHIWESQK